MTCPCGHQFCWFCLKDYVDSPSQIYSIHEPKECFFILFSKIVILFTCLISLSSFILGGESIRLILNWFFIAIAYLFHAILIDLWIIFQSWLIYSMDKQKNIAYSYYPFKHTSIPLKIIVFIILNFVVIYLTDSLDFAVESGCIIAVEVAIVAIISFVWVVVVFTCETWF